MDDLNKLLASNLCLRLKAQAAISLQAAGIAPDPALRKYFNDSALLMMEAVDMIRPDRAPAGRQEKAVSHA